MEPRTISDLSADPNNPRKIDDDAAAGLRYSMESFGNLSGIVWNERTEQLVAGHQRIAALQEIYGDLEIEDGAIACPNGDTFSVRFVDWDEDMQRAANVAANNPTIAGTFDERLGGILKEIQASDKDLFDKLRFESLAKIEHVDLSDKPEMEDVEPQIDRAEELKEKWGTELGQLWIVDGKQSHRLLCGDSTIIESWQRLEIPKNAVCFTSPPYNLGTSVSLSGNKVMSAKSNAYDGYNDSVSPEVWRQMCDKFLDNAFSFCEAAVFNVQSLANNRRQILQWIADRKEYRDIVTWDKGHAAPAMASGVMSSRFEWLVVFGLGKSSRCIPLSSWRGTVSNVYTAPPQRNNEWSKHHAATFPVHLPAWVMSVLCNVSSAAVDCCLGSGTTMLAAEQLGRRCFGMEISPAYCAVILERMKDAGCECRMSDSS